MDFDVSSISSSEGDSKKTANKKKTLRLKVKLLKKKLKATKDPATRAQVSTSLADVKSKAKDLKKEKKKEKKKGKKKKKKKKKDSSSASSGSKTSDSSSEDPLFGVASPSGMEPRGLARVASREPGKLYNSAVAGIAKNLGVRGGAKNPESAMMWLNYLQDVLRHRATDLPAARLQEMRTLCAALAAGARGQTKTLLDILSQRFVSLEAQSTGQAALAPALELVESTQEGLAGNAQMRVASHELNRNARHAAAIARVPRS